MRPQAGSFSGHCIIWKKEREFNLKWYVKIVLFGVTKYHIPDWAAFCDSSCTLSLGRHLRVELSHGVSSVTGYYLRLKSGMQQCAVSNLVFQKDLVSYATLISIDIADFIFDVKCKYEPVSYLTPWKNEPNSTLSKRSKWKTTWYLYGEISCCRKWNNTKVQCVLGLINKLFY